MESLNRRNFLLTSALLTGAAACGAAEGQKVTEPPPSPYVLPNGATILFQGDSVTAAGRDAGYSAANDANAMGTGYPLFIAQHLLLARPKQGLKIYNRGIGGDTVPLLQARWQTDTIAIQPDLLSILVGLNDFVADHVAHPDYATLYYDRYKALIDTTRNALPNTKIVIVEPYAISDGVATPEFDSVRDAASRIATYANAIYVPIHAMLNQDVVSETHEYWFEPAPGQHPTIAGSAAIADKWLTTVGLA